MRNFDGGIYKAFPAHRQLCRNSRLSSTLFGVKQRVSKETRAILIDNQRS